MGTLKDLGESGIIQMLRALTRERMPGLALGIGDDCAMFSFYDDAYYYLVSTDMLMERVHFKVGQMTPYQLGLRSLAVNLSDIAAMGGTPIASFLSLALPPHLDESWIKGFSDGYAYLTNLHHTALLGGDTVRSNGDIVVSVTILGKVLKGDEKIRSAAQSGDLIVVSGTLGDSCAGRLIADERNRRIEAHGTEVQTHLLQRYYEPSPRLALGQALSKIPGVHAMMDIYDGLVSDLPKILSLSHVDATIQLDKLPISEELEAECSMRAKWSSETMAVTGGEDYELLFTISEGDLDQLPEPDRKSGIPPLTVIGRVGSMKGDEPVIHWERKKRHVTRDFRPYNHFR